MRIVLTVVILAVIALPVAAQPSLGVSRDDIVDRLTSAEIEFEWRDSPLNTGERRFLGTRSDPLVVMELRGPPENLSRIVVMFSPGANVAQTMSGVLSAILALQVVFPEWAEAVQWFGDQAERPGDEYTTTRRGIEVTVFPGRGEQSTMLVIG